MDLFLSRSTQVFYRLVGFLRKCGVFVLDEFEVNDCLELFCLSRKVFFSDSMKSCSSSMLFRFVCLTLFGRGTNSLISEFETTSSIWVSLFSRSENFWEKKKKTLNSWVSWWESGRYWNDFQKSDFWKISFDYFQKGMRSHSLEWCWKFVIFVLLSSRGQQSSVLSSRRVRSGI